MCSYGALSARIPHCLKKKSPREAFVFSTLDAALLHWACHPLATMLWPSSAYLQLIFSLSSSTPATCAVTLQLSATPTPMGGELSPPASVAMAQ
jgi:hypothetical protein